MTSLRSASFKSVPVKLASFMSASPTSVPVKLARPRSASVRRTASLCDPIGLVVMAIASRTTLLPSLVDHKTTIERFWYEIFGQFFIVNEESLQRITQLDLCCLASSTRINIYSNRLQVPNDNNMAFCY